MSDKTRNEVRALVERFVDDLSRVMEATVSDAVSEAVTEALGAGAKRRKKTKRAVRKASKRRVTKKASKKKRGKKKATRKASRKASKKTRRRAKRTPEQLAKLESALLREIKKKSGQRKEDLARALGVSTKDLMLPAKKLIEDKKVRTRGQTRATQYFAR